jgi:hypothetical protein
LSENSLTVKRFSGKNPRLGEQKTIFGFQKDIPGKVSLLNGLKVLEFARRLKKMSFDAIKKFGLKISYSEQTHCMLA